MPKFFTWSFAGMAWHDALVRIMIIKQVLDTFYALFHANSYAYMWRVSQETITYIPSPSGGFESFPHVHACRNHHDMEMGMAIDDKAVQGSVTPDYCDESRTATCTENIEYSTLWGGLSCRLGAS